MKHVMFLCALGILGLALLVLFRTARLAVQSRSKSHTLTALFFLALFYHLSLSTGLFYARLNIAGWTGSGPASALNTLYELGTVPVVAALCMLWAEILRLRMDLKSPKTFFALMATAEAALALAVALLEGKASGRAMFAGLMLAYAWVSLGAALALRALNRQKIPPYGLKKAFYGTLLVGLLNGALTASLFFGLLVPGIISVLQLASPLVALVYGATALSALAPIAPSAELSAEPLAELARRYGISKRELEVLALVAQGWLNKEIEKELGISLATVKDHVSSLMKKTGAVNRVQLAALVRDSKAENQG